MLTKEQLQEAATKYDLPVSTIQAVIYVESGGSGFLPSEKPKILFEGHIFWRELKKLGIDPNKYVVGNENVLYMNWTKAFYVGGDGEHERLFQDIPHYYSYKPILRLGMRKPLKNYLFILSLKVSKQLIFTL